MPSTRKRKKHYFTVEQANAMLPLLRTILRDVTTLAHKLTDEHRRLERLQEEPEPATEAVLERALAEIEQAQEQMRAYEQELKELNVELKDYLTGLIDFPARMDGRDVYLCWRLGEPEVGHWHELDGGFAARQKLTQVTNH